MPRKLVWDPCTWIRLEDEGIGGDPAAVRLRLGAGSGGHLQEGAEDGGGRGGEKVTGLTPRMSPGCHRDGCCCWSHCRSSGGWSSWLLPGAASACSSGERVRMSFHDFPTPLPCPCQSSWHQTYPGTGPPRIAGTTCSRLIPDTVLRNQSWQCSGGPYGVLGIKPESMACKSKFCLSGLRERVRVSE